LSLLSFEDPRSGNSARSGPEEKDFTVRLVVALIQPTKLKAVQEALARVGVERMTVCDALGFGQQQGHDRTKNAGAPRGPKLLRKVALEIACNEDFLERTVETIRQVAKSGSAGAIGDGKIFVLPMEECVRLSDGVEGPEAIS
jgi:nitrogen regulatory protein P-II 1